MGSTGKSRPRDSLAPLREREGLASPRSEDAHRRPEGDSAMFGFLRLKKHGLSARDERLYRASYCGTCHGLRECMGLPSTLLTSYDATFLHVIWAALEAHVHPITQVEERRCTVMPLRRVPVQPLSSASRDGLSALAVSVVAAKLRDDVEDERGLAQRIGLALLRSRAEKAERILGEQQFPLPLLRTLGSRQQAVERDPRATLHELALPTAELMAGVFAHAGRVVGLPSLAGSLETLGGSLGRFLYAWDALHDRDRDRKRGTFNALQAVFGDSHETSRVAVRAFLLHELSAFERAMRDLPPGRAGAHRPKPGPLAAMPGPQGAAHARGKCPGPPAAGARTAPCPRARRRGLRRM